MTKPSMEGLVTDLRRLQSHFPAFGSGAKNRIAKMNALLEDAQTKDPNWEELAKELGAFAKIKAVPSEEFKLRMLELRDRCALKARWKPEFWDQLLPHVPRLLRTLREGCVEVLGRGVRVDPKILVSSAP